MTPPEAGMTIGEANWILWGFALQAGLCPLHRCLLSPGRDGTRFILGRCRRCCRDWYLDPATGRCCGWWLNRHARHQVTQGWIWDKAPGY